MVSYGSKTDSQVYILNKATTYYLAGLAVAIGFRMNLFNIGVDGQYRLAAFFAAVVGGARHAARHPADPADHPRRDAGRRDVGRHRRCAEGDPRGQRGHLDDHAELDRHRGHRLPAPARPARRSSTSNDQQRAPPSRCCRSPAGSSSDGQTRPPARSEGFVVIAVLAGIVYWFTLVAHPLRLRPAHRRPVRSRPPRPAASTSSDDRHQHADLRRASPVWSACPTLLNDAHTYSTDFPTGIGFTGIAVALLGRNHPFGIAHRRAAVGLPGARTSNWLEFNGYDKEIVGVIQGVIVLCVVIAYELVRRYGLEPPAAQGRRGTRRRRPARTERRRRRLRHERHATAPRRPRPPRRPVPPGRRQLSLPVVLLIVAAALLLVSAVRAITGATDVTSAGQIGARAGHGRADRPRRTRRPVVRAGRRRQHRP